MDTTGTEWRLKGELQESTKDQDRSNNNEQDLNGNKTAIRGAEKGEEEANLFEVKSRKSSDGEPRPANASGEQQQVIVDSENRLGDLGTNSPACVAAEQSSSGDEWHLLEPEDEDGSEPPIDLAEEVGVQAVKRAAKLRPSVHGAEKSLKNRIQTAGQPRGAGLRDENGNQSFIEWEPSVRSEEEPLMVHLCTALYALVPLSSLCVFVALLCSLWTPFWPGAILYFGYLLADRHTCNRGGRRMKRVHESKFWTYLAAYFPIKLRCPPNLSLDPNENYILNYHPHGIAAFGCVASFATNALNFNQLFPGIRARFMVHETSFFVPLMREIFALRGDCSVNSRSFDYLLEKSYKQPNHPEARGNLLALVAGGLAEADLSDPQTLRVVLAKRKGFVRKALKHGAHLVPCIAFGENSVYTKVNLKPNSFWHRLETRWYNVMKFKHPIYYGTSVTGIPDRRGGAMPYKKPITVVMGEPIRVSHRVEWPSDEQVDQLHAIYVDKLKQLYSANRDLCEQYDTCLEIV